MRMRLRSGDLRRFQPRVFANSPSRAQVSARSALRGPPVPKLVEYATQQQTDLILLASHGRTGIEHLMIGSVAEKLAR